MKEKEKIETIVEQCFNSSLGQQCDSLFSTPDDRIFIRYEEAYCHCKDHKIPHGEIKEWFCEWNEADDKFNVICM